MRRVLLASFALGMAWATPGAAAIACAPPVAFVETPHPAPAPVEQLVSRSEEIIIERPLAAVLESYAATSLEAAIDRGSSLPAVSGTHVLTAGEFFAPGSRRLVCLTDGSTLLEQVLERTQQDNWYRFRYVVWSYTSTQARAIAYAVGQFLYTDIGDGRTRVTWTYAFQLKRDTFPGYLGFVGDYLFRWNFLDRPFADLMRRTLAASKARAEAAAPPR